MRRAALLVVAGAAIASLVAPSHAAVAAARCAGTAPREDGCTVKFPVPAEILHVNISTNVFVGTVVARVTDDAGSMVQTTCTFPANGRRITIPPSVTPSVTPKCISWASGLFTIGEEATMTVRTSSADGALPALGSWSVTTG